MHILFKKSLYFVALLMIPVVGRMQDSDPTSSSGSSLSGVVFQDENVDGIMQKTEIPALGVIVELLNADGTSVSRALTTEKGNYHFEGLIEGIYFLRFEFSADFGVRSRGIEMKSKDYIFVPVPVIRPDSQYSFTRLQLTNPANFKGEEVSPYTP